MKKIHFPLFSSQSNKQFQINLIKGNSICGPKPVRTLTPNWNFTVVETTRHWNEGRGQLVVKSRNSPRLDRKYRLLSVIEGPFVFRPITPENRRRSFLST